MKSTGIDGPEDLPEVGTSSGNRVPFRGEPGVDDRLFTFSGLMSAFDRGIPLITSFRNHIRDKPC
jgi:hypothetical protein